MTAGSQATVCQPIVLCKWAFNSAHLSVILLTSLCHSDPARNEFYWVPPQDEEDTGANIEETPEDERFYIIAGETCVYLLRVWTNCFKLELTFRYLHSIRARVISEIFNDITPKVAPKAPSAQAADAPPPPAGPPPYRLEVSLTPYSPIFT